MAGKQSRGSSKLGAMSRETLHRNINAARESYQLERRWKYGQPAIDRVSAVLNVTEIGVAGSILDSIIKLQGEERQIGVLVFPYGIPVVDGVRIEVNIDEATN